MAEHLNQKVEPPLSCFDNMGKPLHWERKQAAYEACLEIGLSRSKAKECVDALSAQLERDKPYEAQAHGMKFLDLTGVYRVMAVLLS